MNKRVISLLICLVMVLTLLSAAPALAIPATGEWVTVDGVVGGQICFDNGTGTITASDTTITQAHIPNMIKGTPVETIGVRAFAFDSLLTSITMPNSVTKIEQGAFYGCAALRNITFSTRLQSIGIAVFNGCTALSSVTLPATLGIIGPTTLYNSFFDCSALTAINVHKDNPYFTSKDGVLFSHDRKTLIAYPRARSGAYTIPSSVQVIAMNAFSNCSRLTGITISDGVKTIMGDAFTRCTGLTSVTLPASVLSIDPQAFSRCGALWEINVDEFNTRYASVDGVLFDKNLTTLIRYPGGRASASYTIPASVTTIGNFAFSGCTHLESITIPGGVTSLPGNAFEYCPNLTAIHVDASNGSFTSSDGVVFKNSGTELVCCPSGRTGTYTIPSGVTSIGYCAFWTCSKLTDITIPEGVTSIGSLAFSRCTRLTRLTLPSSVNSIGDGAFMDCDSLTRLDVTEQNDSFTSSDGILFNEDCTTLITFPSGRQGVYAVPSGVSVIRQLAFATCQKITGVKLPASVSVLSDGAFSDCYKLKSVGFMGDAPTLENARELPYSDVFRLHHPALMLYYLEGQAGWDTPHWKEYRTALWDGQELPIPPDPPEATGAAGMFGLGDAADHGIDYRLVGELFWLPDGGLKCIVDAERAKYVSTSIDNIPLEKGDVTVTEGSTVVTVSGARIARLTDGAHTLRIQFTDGRAEAAFTTPHNGAMLTASIPDVPATGGAPLWALPLLGLLGAAYRRRRTALPH